MEARRIAGTMGAEVVGVNLRARVSDRCAAEIRALLLDHLALFFPDQHLDPRQQVAFARCFGPSGETPFIDPIPDHPDVIAVVKEPHEAAALNFGGVWHSDFSFQAAPPALTVLVAVEVPPYGGDTVFANMYLAYDGLPRRLQARCDHLMAVHTARDAYGPRMQAVHDRLGSMSVHTSDEADAEQVHPLVLTHPETGRRALFFNQGYVKGIRGFDPAEAEPFLHMLHQHTTQVAYTCRYRWTAGTVALWDNRCTQHYAMNDYGGYRRIMHRTTVAGTAPTSPARRLLNRTIRPRSVPRPAAEPTTLTR